MDTETSPVSRDADLIDTLRGVSAQPLWDRYQRITRRQPVGLGAAGHWPWAQMEPLIARAVAEVSMADAERRVLLLTHPDRPGAATTGNLLAGLQTLMPGESAHPHRHTIAALRFVMEGEGAQTTVNDAVCAMSAGDLVLTPSWTWHAHTHAGTGRMVWFDGLDLPLCTHLDTMFFEPGVPPLQHVEPPPTRPAPAQPGVATLGPDAVDDPAGSRFRYAAARARAALAAAPVAADGSRCLRYVDGRSGGPVLPSLDCHLTALPPGRPGAARRSTASVVCVVVAGAGQSTIGEQTLHWQRNDVFVLPHWQWVRHQAGPDGATLFSMSDRELLDSLHYLREDTQA